MILLFVSALLIYYTCRNKFIIVTTREINRSVSRVKIRKSLGNSYFYSVDLGDGCDECGAACAAGAGGWRVSKWGGECDNRTRTVVSLECRHGYRYGFWMAQMKITLPRPFQRKGDVKFLTEPIVLTLDLAVLV